MEFEEASMQAKKQRQTNTPTPVATSGTKWDFEPLDKNSFTPMYFQIQTQLLQMIQAGRLRAGDPLPSEEELSRIYGVSRMTSRQALQALKSQGFASRHKGHGSFVSQPRVEKDITHLCGFTAEMRALGITATSRVLEAETLPAPAELASQLGIAVNAPIYRLRRLRLADDTAHCSRRDPAPVRPLPGRGQTRFFTLVALPYSSHALRNSSEPSRRNSGSSFGDTPRGGTAGNSATVQPAGDFAHFVEYGRATRRNGSFCLSWRPLPCRAADTGNGNGINSL